MYVPKYHDRETVAATAINAENTFPAYIDDVIRAAGITADYADYVLTPNATACKQDGPRSAIYSVTDFSNGILMTAARFYPNTEDGNVVEADKQAIKTAVGELVTTMGTLDKPTFTLAHNIASLFAFPGTRSLLLGAGVEIRVAPDETAYAALLVPTYFRKAPKAIQRYIEGVKRDGSKTEIAPQLWDLARSNDTRKVARQLSLSTIHHILQNYDELEQFTAEFGPREEDN